MLFRSQDNINKNNYFQMKKLSNSENYFHRLYVNSALGFQRTL